MGKQAGNLEPKQERFCHEYIIDCNGTQAAIRAGYSTVSAGQLAFELLKKHEIQERVSALKAKQLERIDLSADRVLREIYRIATADVGLAFNSDGGLLPIKEIPEDVRRAISGLDVEELFEGRGDEREQTGVLKKIRFWSKTEAARDLAKHLGLLIDRLELNGKVDIADSLRKARERSGLKK